MNRSRSKSRLVETAFVSQTQSSAEDLDEVDWMANHPVLRPNPVPENSNPGRHRKQTRSWRPFTSSMKKSKSEIGGYCSERGGKFSIALSQPILGYPNTNSGQNSLVMADAHSKSKYQEGVSSYTPPAEFGCRTVAVGMLRGHGSRIMRGNMSRMKRSTTINFQQFYSSQNNSEENNIHQHDHHSNNFIHNISKSSSNPYSFDLEHNCSKGSSSSSYWSHWTEEGKEADNTALSQSLHISYHDKAVLNSSSAHSTSSQNRNDALEFGVMENIMNLSSAIGGKNVVTTAAIVEPLYDSMDNSQHEALSSCSKG